MSQKRPTCKYMRGKIIRLHQTCQTRGGNIFYEGEYLVVRKMLSDGTMELHRPMGNLITQYSPAMEIIGDVKTLFNRPSETEK